MIDLAQGWGLGNFESANVGAGLWAIWGLQDSLAALAPNGPTRGTKWPEWVDSALNRAGAGISSFPCVAGT